MKYARVSSVVATHVLRAELREGLETMPLSRPHSKIAAALAIVLAVFCAVLFPGIAVAQSTDDRVISANGIGAADLGLTPDGLSEALGDDYQVGDEVRITVDFDGRVITSDSKVQFRAAMTDDSDLLTLFIVSNPNYATAEGVGPTTTIAEAEEVYGQATLTWNLDNEGREFVTFENGPDGRIAFRTPGIGGTNVGIYEDDQFETTEYDPDGAIAAVWISCIAGQDCPQDQAVQATPEPTATAEATPEPTATPEATPEPTATPEAAPTPAATPTPDATAEPTPTASPTPAADDDASGATDVDELPRTGAAELVLIAIVAMLFAIGGAFVLIERQYLCPAWLTSRR